jgi:hypothetical protein
MVQFLAYFIFGVELWKTKVFLLTFGGKEGKKSLAVAEKSDYTISVTRSDGSTWGDASSLGEAECLGDLK